MPPLPLKLIMLSAVVVKDSVGFTVEIVVEILQLRSTSLSKVRLSAKRSTSNVPVKGGGYGGGVAIPSKDFIS